MPNVDRSQQLISSAIPILKDAVNYDSSNKENDAFQKYMEGIELLAEALSLMSTDDTRKEGVRAQMKSYMSRAELLKLDCKTEVGFIEQRRIAANSVGHSYDKVFGKCCDDKLKVIRVQDAYIIAHHQLLNFVRFCELVVSLSKNLKVIHLKTSTDARSNEKNFSELNTSLKQRDVTLHVEYVEKLHDREIRFDNGWVVKSGRGLDYFKPTTGGKYVLGACDMSLRPCHETTIDIFKAKK